MKRLTGSCNETELIPSEGRGYGLAVQITSSGDETVPISGLFLCRKGINAFPEFAEGFGFDTSKVVEGLPPEHYQLRVQMLVSHQGRLLYGDGKSEFQLPPTKTVRFVIPLPFQGVQYFLTAPPEDLFLAAKNLTHDEVVIEIPELQGVILKSVEVHGQLGVPLNVQIEIIVPSSEPPSQEHADKVGTTNSKPIRPMPNN